MEEKNDQIVACDQCGEVKLCSWMGSPYADDICPNAPNPPEWWCGRCAREAAADV